MANNTSTVTLPAQLVRNALDLAEKSARRAALTQTAKYGPEHILVQTLHDEAIAYKTAVVKDA